MNDENSTGSILLKSIIPSIALVIALMVIALEITYQGANTLKPVLIGIAIASGLNSIHNLSVTIPRKYWLHATIFGVVILALTIAFILLDPEPTTSGKTVWIKKTI